MGGNCPERLDRKKLPLYKNVLTFNHQHRKNYYTMLEKSKAQVIVFHSRKQADTYIKNGAV